MVFKRFGNFLLTDSGRSFCMYTALAVGTAVCSANVLPNTIFLHKFKEVIHLYKNGLSVPVPEDLRKRFDKVVELVEIPENERHLYKPFMVYGFDVYNIGCGYSKYGGLVGLPVNFTYTNVDSIDKSQIKVNNESVLWDLDEGKELLESMVLSENAQMYGMARELKMVSSAKFILDTCYRTFGVFMCYGLSLLFNQRLNLHSKPRSVRFALYSLIAGFTFGNYAFFKDFTQVHYEQSIDKFLKEKDPIFIEGGKEFYEKILLRNRALRKLLGKAGESHYSVLGNENYFIRQKHVPIVHRKEFFDGTKVLA